MLQTEIARPARRERGTITGEQHASGKVRMQFAGRIKGLVTTRHAATPDHAASTALHETQRPLQPVRRTASRQPVPVVDTDVTPASTGDQTVRKTQHVPEEREITAESGGHGRGGDVPLTAKEDNEGPKKPITITPDEIHDRGIVALCEAMAESGRPFHVSIGGHHLGSIRQPIPWEKAGDERGRTLLLAPEELDEMGVSEALYQLSNMPKIHFSDAEAKGYIWYDDTIKGVLEFARSEDSRR